MRAVACIIAFAAAYVWVQVKLEGVDKVEPAGYDVEQYSFPDSISLKSIWAEEALGWEGYRR